MRFLTNIYDPKQKDANLVHCYSEEASGNPDLRDLEWQTHLAWVNQNIIGRPQATKAYTVEQLEAMHIIGVYAL